MLLSMIFFSKRLVSNLKLAGLYYTDLKERIHELKKVYEYIKEYFQHSASIYEVL